MSLADSTEMATSLSSSSMNNIGTSYNSIDHSPLSSPSALSSSSPPPPPPPSSSLPPSSCLNTILETTGSIETSSLQLPSTILPTSTTNNNNNNINTRGNLAVNRHEFDCSLCLNLLFEPLTIECGHTFCRDCLLLAFQSNKYCPLCRRYSIVDPATHAVNTLVAKLLEKYNTHRYAKRSQQVLKERAQRKVRLPIFCSRIAAFPFTKIGLHIYEPMYRIMVDRILRSDRLFVVSYNMTSSHAAFFENNGNRSGNTSPRINNNGRSGDARIDNESNTTTTTSNRTHHSYAEYAYQSLIRNYRNHFSTNGDITNLNHNNGNDGNNGVYARDYNDTDVYNVHYPERATPGYRPHVIGVVCRIDRCTSLPDGRSMIQVFGVKRVKLTDICVEENSYGLLSAVVEDYIDICADELIKQQQQLMTLIHAQQKQKRSAGKKRLSLLGNESSIIEGEDDFIEKEKSTIDDGLNDKSLSSSFLHNSTLTLSSRPLQLLGETSNNTGETNDTSHHDSHPNNSNQTTTTTTTSGNTIENFNSNGSLETNTDDNLSLTAQARKDQARREAELMNILLKKVEKFVKDTEQGDMIRFQNRVGNVPTNPSDFSLWVAGALPMRLHNTDIHQEIAQWQIQILTSRNVQKRLKLATYLATACIECAQRRSKAQFWIIVTIIVMAVLFEIFHGRQK